MRKTQRMLALAGLTLTASAGLAMASTAAFAAPQGTTVVQPGPSNNQGNTNQGNNNQGNNPGNNNQGSNDPNHQNGNTTTISLPWLGNGGTTIVVNRDSHNGHWGDGRDNNWRQHGDTMRYGGTYYSLGACEREGYWGEYRGFWDDFTCYRWGHRYVLETIDYGHSHHW